jgi:hypothetical protein
LRPSFRHFARTLWICRRKLVRADMRVLAGFRTVIAF